MRRTKPGRAAGGRDGAGRAARPCSSAVRTVPRLASGQGAAPAPWTLSQPLPSFGSWEAEGGHVRVGIPEGLPMAKGRRIGAV